jgi:4-amino-4-deoxychorismate lyase
MRVLLDGREGARVDPLDRGLQYGDGLFETIAVLDGQPRFFDWHVERLALGARRLGIPLPETALLRAEIASACDSPRAVAKVILTRGVGERGYRAPARPVPLRIVAGFAWPSLPARAADEGVRVGWCRTRLARQPALAGIKHLNRLEQVLARAEWEDGDMSEGLMQDDDGHVISGTQSNLFARISGQWVTPRLDECGVAGVMRRAFLERHRGGGRPAVERVIPAAELAEASAILLTNALIGAWPVRELAGRALAIDADVAAFNAWLAAP